MPARFGPFELDVDAYELRRAGEPVHLEPQVLEIISYLVTHRDRVVRKEELLDQIWGDRFVSESALTTRVKEARRALDDDGRTQSVIRTVHGRGYQFVAPLEETASGGVPGAATEPGSDGNPGAAHAALPVAPHAIHGRDDELRALRDLLTAARVVTIVGAGGAGKTRLALELATTQASTDAVPVAFVQLAQITDGAVVADAIAAAVGIQVGQRSEAVDACVELFAGHPYLLVLDNCEHLLRDVAGVVAQLVSRGHCLRVLATSREPLGTAGEQVFRLGPLPVPAWEPDRADTLARAPIVVLFAERARAADPDFSLDDTDLGTVLALCRSLDGLPLAVELAAGRVGALDVSDLRSRLDRRLDLIGAARAATGDRHGTLRALVDWSYGLLDDDQRRLLVRLSVFPGAVSLDTVEWIAEDLGLEQDPAVAVARLVDASMITRSSTPQGARYSQLETVRAFGLDVLTRQGEEDAATDALTGWAEDFAARAEAGLESAAEPAWDARVRQELPNLRAARAALLRSGQVDRVVELVWRLSEWSWFRPVVEFRRWQLELATQVESAAPPVRRLGRALAAEASWLAGRLDDAERLVTELDRDGLEDPRVRAQTMHTRAAIALFRGEFATAARLWQERFELLGRPADLGSAAVAAAYGGDVPAARALVAEARACTREGATPTHRAWIHYAAGETEAVAGSGAHVDDLEAAIAEGNRTGATFVSGVARVTLVSGQARSGEVDVAAPAFVELIDHWLRGGNWTQQWVTLSNVAELLVGIDDRVAVALWAAAAADPFAPALDDDDRARIAAARDAIVARLGAAEVARVEADALTHDRGYHADAAVAALTRLSTA